jgi:hypothetical protein
VPWQPQDQKGPRGGNGTVFLIIFVLLLVFGIFNAIIFFTSLINMNSRRNPYEIPSGVPQLLPGPLTSEISKARF